MHHRLDAMATPEEVTMSVGEVVMLKTDTEGDLDDPNKTQVILQLQPINTGDETAETNAAIMTVEALPHNSEGEDMEIGCPITCGESEAVLLLKKFLCPGINVKCVKYEDQLISPKQFVHLSGKSTLKDWKRAIRMGGVMLRKMMDSGKLDFYQHSKLCANTCRSTKFDILINNTRFPPDSSGLMMPTSSQGPLLVRNGGSTGEEVAELLSGMSGVKASSVEAAGKANSTEISEDALTFWKGIADVGLLGEVVTNVTMELMEMLNSLKQQQDSVILQDTEVAVLNNLSQVFGLLNMVQKVLERRRQETDPSQEHVLIALNNLDLKLEEQKKQHQLRALLSCPQLAKNKTVTKRQTKRPRLQRASSTATLLTSAINLQASPQPQQFTVLSPISLSSVGQPITMTGLPITSLAQSSNKVTLLPANSQLFTRYMFAGDGKTEAITLHPSSGLTLVGATAVQESGQLVSPVELVHLSQQPGSRRQAVNTAMLVQQEVERSQEHTVIEINPTPMEQTVGIMELQLQGVSEQDGVELTMAEADSSSQIQQAQTDELVQGLQLDANGHLSGVQFVVFEQNTRQETDSNEP